MTVRKFLLNISKESELHIYIKSKNIDEFSNPLAVKKICFIVCPNCHDVDNRTISHAALDLFTSENPKWQQITQLLGQTNDVYVSCSIKNQNHPDVLGVKLPVQYGATDMPIVFSKTPLCD